MSAPAGASAVVSEGGAVAGAGDTLSWVSAMASAVSSSGTQYQSDNQSRSVYQD